MGEIEDSGKNELGQLRTYVQFLNERTTYINEEAKDTCVPTSFKINK